MRINLSTTCLLMVAAACGAHVGAAHATDLATDVATGIIKTLQGVVTVQRGAIAIPAELGLPVAQADQIVTGNDGTVGITFQDNSLLSLGPNSRLTIQHFEFDSTTHDGSFETALERGKLAVVSGKIAKHKQDAMKVRTPSSILGVRGTEFLVEVRP